MIWMNKVGFPCSRENEWKRHFQNIANEHNRLGLVPHGHAHRRDGAGINSTLLMRIRNGIQGIMPLQKNDRLPDSKNYEMLSRQSEEFRPQKLPYLETKTKQKENKL
jgi:hypothetical protein